METVAVVVHTRAQQPRDRGFRDFAGVAVGIGAGALIWLAVLLVRLS